MFNLGGLEIVVILVVAFLVLGPDKLPGFMSSIGKAMGEMRRVSSDFSNTMRNAIAEDGAPRAAKDGKPPLAVAQENSPTTPYLGTPSTRGPSDAATPAAQPGGSLGSRAKRPALRAMNGRRHRAAKAARGNTP